MQLSQHIQNLLYRHDCVIVPNFGGFISNRIGARIDNETHFYPPYKKLGFNASLCHNDGLLTNEVAAEEHLSFEEANKRIQQEVQRWNTVLKSGSLVLEQVGSFELSQNQQLVFEPDQSVNYLTSSFGLNRFEQDQVSRKEVKVVAMTPERKGVPAFIKYAATAAIVRKQCLAGTQGPVEDRGGCSLRGGEVCVARGES